MGHSVLLVPVPELEEFVLGRTAHYDAAFVSADPGFTHAHVTVLGPFVPTLDEATRARIGELASRVEPFDFRLEQVATFPNGIVHLCPEPDEGFRALTELFSEEFPEFPPYAGEFDPEPHLTLDALSDQVSEESTRALVGPHLPAYCRARRLDLAWYDAHDCRVLASWRLGG